MGKEEDDIEIFNEIKNDVMKITFQCYSGNDRLNRKCGPVNKGDWECPKSPDGLCRLLTCQCRENDDGLNDDDEDWFMDFCDFCEDRIPYRNLALRIPMQHGGFMGCYCSIQCIEEVYLNGDVERIYLVDALVSNLRECPIELVTLSETEEGF